MSADLLWIRGIITWQREVNAHSPHYGLQEAYDWIAHVATGGHADTFWKDGRRSPDYIWVWSWVAKRGSSVFDSDSE